MSTSSSELHRPNFIDGRVAFDEAGVHRQLHAGERAFGVLHAPREHALRVVEHRRRVRGIGGDVADLRGIGVEVEEDRTAASGNPENCTYLPWSSRSTASAHSSSVSPNTSSRSALSGSRKSNSKCASRRQSSGVVALEPRRQRAPVALQRHVRAEQLADRRQHVDVLGERVDDTRRRRTPGPRTINGTWYDSSNQPSLCSM